jgi:ABC-type glycerol-3-phosphate transport system substrate-binding protein
VTYADPGFLMQLDNQPRMRKEIADFIEKPLAVAQYKGKLYGLTYYNDTRIMLYRKDMLREAGLPTDQKSLPKTWAQFADVARRLVRWEGTTLKRSGFVLPNPIGELFYLPLAQQGKGLMDEQMTKATFDGAEGVQAMQTLVDLMHRDRVDAFERPPTPQGMNNIGAGTAAIVWTSSTAIAAMERAGQNPSDLLLTEFVPGYTEKRNAHAYLGGTWQLLAKETKAPEETIELGLYLTGPEHTLNVAQATTTVPGRKSLDKAPYLQNPLLRPFYDALSYGFAVPVHVKFSGLRGKLFDATTAALKQEKGIKAALSEAADYWNATLRGG